MIRNWNSITATVFQNESLAAERKWLTSNGTIFMDKKMLQQQLIKKYIYIYILNIDCSILLILSSKA